MLTVLVAKVPVKRHLPLQSCYGASLAQDQ